MQSCHVIQELDKHPEGEFLQLLAFNGHHFGACQMTGESPVWEMHPDTDEYFQILSGHFEITLYEAAGPQHYIFKAGESFVVPRGVWHKPAAPDGAQFMYFTPGQSLHSEADDPRSESERSSANH